MREFAPLTMEQRQAWDAYATAAIHELMRRHTRLPGPLDEQHVARVAGDVADRMLERRMIALDGETP